VLSHKEQTRRKFIKLNDKWKNCKRCKLHKCRTKVVVGNGNLMSRFLIIGQNPGREEDEQGIPFVGKSGQLLDKVVRRYGIKREDFYITNVVSCLSPGNRKPTDSEIQACSKRLDRIIKILDPFVTICLGDTAIRRMFPDYHKDMGVGTARGIYRRDYPPRVDKIRYVCCTYHPSYLIRNKGNKKIMKEWLNDWKRIAELILKCKENL